MQRMRLTVVVLFGVAACSDPAPPGQGLDAAMVQQVLSRVDRLVAVLEAHGSAGRPVSTGAVVAASAMDAVAEPSERVDASPDSEVSSRLEALERTVALLASSRGAPTVTVPASGAPPMRVAVVSSMCEQKDTETARCSVVGQTPQAVMDRFGAPSGVGIVDGHQQWYYTDPGSGHGFSLLFVDGVVVSLN